MFASLSPSNRLLNDANRYLKTRAGFDVRHILGAPLQAVPDRFAAKPRKIYNSAAIHSAFQD